MLPDLYHTQVMPDECSWVIEDEATGFGRAVVVELQKRDWGKWEHLLASDVSVPDTTVKEG
jgi:hypothetical protein